MLKLKLQYFGHLMQRADWLEKTLMVGKIEGRKRRGWQRMRLLDGITGSMDTSLSKLWEIVKNREDRHAAVYGIAKRQTRLSDWTTSGKLSLLTAVGDKTQKQWLVAVPICRKSMWPQLRNEDQGGEGIHRHTRKKAMWRRRQRLSYKLRNAENCWQPPEAQKLGAGSLEGLQEEHCQHLDFWLLAFSLWENASLLF